MIRTDRERGAYATPEHSEAIEGGAVVVPRIPTGAWLAGAFVVLAAAHGWIAGSSSAPSWPSVLAPGAALIACFGALRALPPAAAGPWVLIGCAALCAGLGELLGLATPDTARLLLPAAALTQLAYAAGLAWTVHSRDRHRRSEIALEIVLVVGAVSLGLFRWAPGVRGALAGNAPALVVLDTTISPAAALCSVAFATVLLASLRTSKARDSAASLAAAALLFTIAAAPAALRLDVAVPFRMAWIAGWGFVAFAGTLVMAGGTALYLPADTDPGGARLRQAVAPLAALVLAIVIVDSGVRAPLTQTTAVLAGLLAAAIALRVSRLLEATRDRHTEQRQLAQNQALVEVSRALAGATHLDQTLERVVEWSTRLLDARAAVIELLSEDGTTLEVRSAAGLPSEFLGLRFPVEGSFTGWVVRHGMARITLDPANEPDIQARSRRFLPRCAVASAPLRFHDRMLGVLSAMAAEGFDRHDLELLGALADQAALAIENARLFEQVNRLSLTDPLTGLANRRRLEEELAREVCAALRGRSLIAVMFDLNEFKEYNDQYGHLAGDEALQLFGHALAAETRAMNLAARYGGDEFVALLGDSTVEGARTFAQRVKRRYDRGFARLGRRPIGVAVGIAQFSKGMTTPQHLIAAADGALYEMKSRRSRVG